MDKADFEKVKKLIGEVIHAYHTAALKGTASHEYLRRIATRLELRYEEKEAKHIEKFMVEFNNDIDKHMVAAAEKAEFKILMDLPRVARNIYRAIFNVMVMNKVEVLDMEHFIEKVVKNVPDGEFKKNLAKALVEMCSDWHAELRQMHNGANAVLAAAKNRTTVSLKLTEMMHTSGASYLKRRQEINLIKHAHKDAVAMAKVEKEIIAMHFHDSKDAAKDVDELKGLQHKSLDEYMKATKLIFVDWENANKSLGELAVKVDDATVKHELPALDKDQMHEIKCVMIEKVLEPFVHSLDEAVNQLDAIRGKAEAEAK